MKKYLLLLLLLLPSPSFAIGYDTTVGATIAVVGTAAALSAAAFGAGPAIATVAIGSAVMGITFPTASTGSVSVIKAQLSPSAVQETPAGWTSPNSPPSTTSAVHYFTVDAAGAPQAPSGSAACNAWVGTMTYLAFVSGSDTTCIYLNTQQNLQHSVSISMYNTCPAGYSNLSGVCTMTNASSVQKPTDGVCNIKRSGNSFAPDAQDPDCSAGVMPTYKGLTVGTNTISATAPDGTTSSVTINPDGSTSVVHTAPGNTGGNPTTTTTTTNLGVPDANGNAVITGQNVQTTNGTGTGNSSTNPIVNVQLDKTGLATSTQQTILQTSTDAIHADTTKIASALDPTGVDNSLGSSKAGLDAAMADKGTAFSGLSTDSHDTGGFSWPWTGSSIMPATCGCFPLTMTFKGYTKSFDWCPYIEEFKSGLAFVLYVLTGYTLMSLLIGRKT